MSCDYKPSMESETGPSTGPRPKALNNNDACVAVDVMWFVIKFVNAKVAPLFPSISKLCYANAKTPMPI